MPRDLVGRDPKDEAQLTASPESQNSAAMGQDWYNDFTIDRGDEGFGFGPSRNAKGDDKALSDLHPYVQTLSLSDVDSCVALENATFPEHERCSREKFIYRLTTCPELSLGLFSTTTPDGPTAALPTYAHSRPPDSASPTKKSTLVAQVIATKCASTTVTDESMEYPSDWRDRVSLSERQGHQEHGRTIAIHSLAALPEFKGRGLGKIVMRSYMQRMESSGIADRIVLLAHDHLIDYYVALGFRNTGKSEVQFGGGEWVNMLYTITEPQPGS
ncbi:MAG: hypothetical protein L6R36_001648 [Xanthoria steineri]|nr:MAG: hypothetical protein L6R36_001648 [Xanthoria steineri]